MLAWEGGGPLEDLLAELAAPQACNRDQRDGKVPAPGLAPGSFLI